MITGRFELYKDGKFMIVPDNEQEHIAMHPWTGRVSRTGSASIIHGILTFVEASVDPDETDQPYEGKKYILYDISDCMTMQPLFLPGNNMDLKGRVPVRRFMSHDQARFEQPDDKSDQEILGLDK